MHASPSAHVLGQIVQQCADNRDAAKDSSEHVALPGRVLGVGHVVQQQAEERENSTSGMIAG